MRALLVVMLAGCWNPEATLKYSGSAQIASGGLRGGEAAFSFGGNGMQLGLGLFGHELLRPMDPNRHLAGGGEFYVRASLFGLLIPGDKHPLEHWFDLGGEGGLLFGAAYPTEFLGVGGGFYGAWADFGLWSGERYPLLVVGIRQIGYSAPWIDETQVSIGLAWGLRWVADMTKFHD